MSKSPSLYSNSERAKTSLIRLFYRMVQTLIILFMFSVPLFYSLSVGNHPAERPSAFSEANRIRAGESYAAEGFYKYSGLPNVAYGTSFRDLGATSLDTLSNKYIYIYTRYPNGPDWIVGAMTYMIGQGNILYYRLPVLFLTLLAFLIICFSIETTYGIQKSIIFMALLAVAPAFYLVGHNFHTNGYALALSFIQWSILILYFNKLSLKRFTYLTLFVLGFLQGCITYDYCFIVTFAPLIFSAFYFQGIDIIKRASMPVTLLGVGFTLAHIFHFLQVAHYLGGFTQAIHEFSSAALYRSIGDSAVDARGAYWQHEPSSQSESHLKLLWRYWSDIIPSYFNGCFLIFVPYVAVLGILGSKKNVKIGGTTISYRPGLYPVIGLLCALLLSSAWVLVMHQHAFIHTHYIPYHFTLVYFTLMLWLIHSFFLNK